MSAELIVRKTGMLTSIQDLGRFGYRCYGVPWSGALHPDLVRIANVLVGNPHDSAVLETLVTGPVLEAGSLSSLFWRHFRPEGNGESIDICPRSFRRNRWFFFVRGRFIDLF